MREKRGIVLAGVLLLGLIAAGCIALLYGSRNRSGDGQSQKKIGAVYMTMNNPYFAVVNNQIEAVAASRKDVVITRDSALDAEMQNRQIKELIKENVDILLVNAIDWKSIRTGLEEAWKAGIPVIAVDAEVYDSELVKAVICSDNYEAGAACARDLMKRKKTASILFLVQNNNKSAMDRIKGFKDTLENAGWQYKTVDELECQGQLEIAQPLVEQVLRKEKDIDVVMGLNDPASLGAMAALDAADMLKQVLVYSVDGAPEAKTMIYEGKMTATAAQSPLSTGRQTAELLYRFLDGEEIPEKTVIPVTLITKDNVETFGLARWQ